MRKTIIFNWKMHPKTLKEARQLLSAYGKGSKKNEIVIAPPFVYISESLKIKNLKLKIGAQNSFWATDGAYTGEISPAMLKNLGVEYVIIGHSERRQYLNETDEIINRKVLIALKAGLKVILCVGEPFRQTTNNKQQTTKAKKYIKNQLVKDLNRIKKLLVVGSKSLVSNLSVAYEPIWALSTTKNKQKETPADAIEMIKYIKRLLSTDYRLQQVKVLYGGSVNSKNIKDFIKFVEIDGVLVGGASVKTKEVKEIIRKI